MHPDDTIAAPASAPGPAPRAVVRLSGPESLAVVAKLRADGPDPTRHAGVERGVLLALPGVHSPLPADLVTSLAPKSYTGQDTVEIHTVGSPPLVELLLAALLANGTRSAGPGEFTLRAFLAGKKDLTQAEAVLGVVEADSDAELHAALGQLAGGVTAPLSKLRDDLLNLLADLEAGLDFSDEDLPFVAPRDVLLRISAALAHLANLERQLGERAVARSGVRVALAGAPNAGKSSLFNALLGRDAALVSGEAGTTRDYLDAAVDLGGLAVTLTDTAGLGAALGEIDAASQTLGRGEQARADFVVWCSPAPEPPSLDGAPEHPRRILARTKADLAPNEALPAGWVAASTVAPGGLGELRAAIKLSVEGRPRPPLSLSHARCRGHVAAAVISLRRAHEHALNDDPAELLALALREALHEVGALAGAVYTDDLLDRVFSRFCVGK